jgi:ABC-type Mn2+/Zn2+ transport system permease subunit
MTLIAHFLASEVMRSALLPALLIAVTTASISVMILAHRLSFLVVGVSHASLAGLGLAVVLALPLLPTVTVVAIAVAWLLIPSTSGKLRLNNDAGTGLLFAGAMALGIVLLSTTSRYQVDLFGWLFGNILTISHGDVIWLYVAAAVVLGSLLLAARAWWAIAFDATAAAASGVPVSAYRFMLHGIVALAVILCVKLAGIVLTTGLMVLPAACAWFWGRSLGALWAISLGISVGGTLVGLLVSYAYNWPSGATVVLTLCVLFALSAAGAWLKQAGRQRRQRA